jgi:hypothetical protein
LLRRLKSTTLPSVFCLVSISRMTKRRNARGTHRTTLHPVFEYGTTVSSFRRFSGGVSVMTLSSTMKVRRKRAWRGWPWAPTLESTSKSPQNGSSGIHDVKVEDLPVVLALSHMPKAILWLVGSFKQENLFLFSGTQKWSDSLHLIACFLRYKINQTIQHPDVTLTPCYLHQTLLLPCCQ